jgi:membrane dipeptidase
MTGPAPLCVDAAVPALEVRGIAEQHARLRQGGVDVALVTAAAIEPPAEALASVAEWWAADADEAAPVRIGTTVAALRAHVAAGSTAVVLHFQGSSMLGGRVDLVDAYARLGVRVMQLTYNHRGEAGDGCLEESDAGLSDFGRGALRRMEARGIIPDISHAGQRTARDVLRAADGPVLASHANARALCDSPRNLTDELLAAVGASGGVVGACAFPAFLVSEGRPTLQTLVDHIKHIADKAGVAHVGLGLDFAAEDERDYDYYGYDERYYPRPPWVWPKGIEWWQDTRNIRAALLDGGFGPDEVDGIMGENFLRAFGSAWD